jgi:hypothetical protein
MLSVTLKSPGCGVDCCRGGPLEAQLAAAGAVPGEATHQAALHTDTAGAKLS